MRGQSVIQECANWYDSESYGFFEVFACSKRGIGSCCGTINTIFAN